MLTLTPEQRSNKVTVADWLISYRDSESRKKRGAKQEVLRINRFLQRPFAALKIGQITYKDLQKYFDERLKETSKKYIGTLAPATAHKEIQTLSAAFNLAVTSGLISKNPCIGVVLPKPAEHRERTASDEDIEALLVASGWDGKSVPLDKLQLTMAAFLLACKTGMRSGEILRIEEAWIDGALIHLPHEVTKTDSRRDVALSSEALRIINLVRELGDKPKLFGALSDATRDARFETAQGLARNSIPPGVSSAKVSTSTTAVRLLRRGRRALIRRPEHRALIFCPSLVRLGTKI